MAGCTWSPKHSPVAVVKYMFGYTDSVDKAIYEATKIYTGVSSEARPRPALPTALPAAQNPTPPPPLSLPLCLLLPQTRVSVLLIPLSVEHPCRCSVVRRVSGSWRRLRLGCARRLLRCWRTTENRERGARLPRRALGAAHCWRSDAQSQVS